MTAADHANPDPTQMGRGGYAPTRGPQNPDAPVRPMTAADHANTVREGIDCDSGDDTAQAAAHAALDALQHQAETAEARVYLLENMRSENYIEALDAMQAERDAAVQAAEDLALSNKALTMHRTAVQDAVDRAEAAEQAAEHAQAALRQIADYYEAEYQEGDKAYQAAIVARAALGNNT